MAYATQPADLIYAHHQGDDRQLRRLQGRRARRRRAWQLKRQNLNWVLPYHDGAVKALKEAGVWTPAAQAHNDGLLKRQATLADGLGRLRQGHAVRTTRTPSTTAGWPGARDGAAARPAWTRSSSSSRTATTGIAMRRADPRRAGQADRVRRSALGRQPAGSRGHAGPHPARFVALGADRRRCGDHPAVHQPAVHAALLRRLHPAQHRVLLSADRADAAVHLPDLSGPRPGARSTACPGTTSLLFVADHRVWRLS